MELKVKIEAPELAQAVQALADALGAQSTQAKLVSHLPSAKEKPKKIEKKNPATKAEDKPTATLEQVRQVLAAYSQDGKAEEVKAIIESFGAKKLTDIPEEKFPEVLEKAAELG